MPRRQETSIDIDIGSHSRSWVKLTFTSGQLGAEEVKRILKQKVFLSNTLKIYEKMESIIIKDNQQATTTTIYSVTLTKPIN